MRAFSSRYRLDVLRSAYLEFGKVLEESRLRELQGLADEVAQSRVALRKRHQHACAYRPGRNNIPGPAIDGA